MRILLVVHQYLPRHRAGTEVYTHSLARALGERHQVLVYCHEPALDGSDTPAVQEPYEGVTVRRVAAATGAGRRSPLQLFASSYHNPTIEADYRRTLDAFRPDLVHAQHVKDLSAGMLGETARRGLPLVMTLHDYWAICPNAQCVRPNGVLCYRTHCHLECGTCAAYRLGRPALRFLSPATIPLFIQRARVVRREFAHVQRFIAPSEFLRQRYIAKGFPADKITQLENGLDLARLGAARSQARGPLRGHYAFIGSLAWQKGPQVLVEAFRALGERGAELRIWGNLQTFPTFARAIQARAAGCSWIHFAGELDSARVGEALAWADYLLVPSLWWENSPVTIQEAYAAGVPVIASNLGALPEKVRDGVSGLLFAPGDIADLTRVLSRTLNEPDLLPRLRAGLPPVVPMADHVQELTRLYATLR